MTGSTALDPEGLAPRFRIHTSTSYRTTITNRGQLGSLGFDLVDSSDVDSPNPRWAPGFESPPFARVDYLYEAGLWVGGIVGGDTLVSTGTLDFFIEGEFRPLGADPPVYSDALGDEEYGTAYADTVTETSEVDEDIVDGAHRPLPVRVSQRSRLVGDSVYSHGLIVEIVVTNIGDETIRDLWLGWLVDCDIGHIDMANVWRHDLSGYRTGAIALEGATFDIRAGWSADNDGKPNDNGAYDDSSATSVFGAMYLGGEPELTERSFNWWNRGFSMQQAVVDWGPQRTPGVTNAIGGRGTPIGDGLRYRFMSNREFDYDQVHAAVDRTADGWIAPTDSAIARDIANGTDTRFLLTMGETDLAAGDSLASVWTFVVAPGWHTDPNHFDSTFDPASPDDYLAGLNMPALDSSLARMMQLWQTEFAVARIGPPRNWVLSGWDDHEAYLSWSPRGTLRLAGYDILRSLDPSIFPDLPIVLLPENDTAHTDSGLDREQTYYYAIRSRGEDGRTGMLSAPVDVLPDRPMRPSGLLTSRADARIDLTWDEPSEADVVRHRVYRRMPGLAYGQIGESQTDAYSDQAARNAHIYEYQVTAVSVLGNESFTSTPRIGIAFAFDGLPLLLDETLSGPTSQTDKDSVATIWNRMVEPASYRDADPAAPHPFTWRIVEPASVSSAPRTDLTALNLYDAHPVTFVVSDGRFAIRPETLDQLPLYVGAGGIAILSGRDLFNSAPLAKGFVEFGPGDFAYDVLGINRAYYPEVLLSNPTRMNAEFVAADPAMTGWPTLDVDPSRTDWGLNPLLPPTAGAVPFVGYFEVDTSRADILYTFGSNQPELSDLQGKPVAVVTRDPQWKAAALAFPLSYCVDEAARSMLNQLLDEFGYVRPSAQMQSARWETARQVLEWLYRSGTRTLDDGCDANSDGRIDLIDVMILNCTSGQQHGATSYQQDRK